MRKLLLAGPIVGIAAGFAVATPAFAATPAVPTTYAPTTTTTTQPSGTQVVANGSTVSVSGSGIATIACAPGTFAAGTTVSIFVNGVFYGTTTANADGSVTLNIVITDPHVSVNGGAAVPISGSSFSLSTSGAANSGATATFAATVLIPTQFQTTAAVTQTPTLAFTGLDVAGLVGGAVILLGAGTALVLFTRRRHIVSHQSSSTD
jgi:hypothetical protein